MLGGSVLFSCPSIILMCFEGCTQFLMSIALSQLVPSPLVFSCSFAASSVSMFIGISPVIMHSASLETVRYALAILMLISLWILTNLACSRIFPSHLSRPEHHIKLMVRLLLCKLSSALCVLGPKLS